MLGEENAGGTKHFPNVIVFIHNGCMQAFLSVSSLSQSSLFCLAYILTCRTSHVWIHSQSSFQVMTSLSFADTKQRDVSWLPRSTQVEESYQTSLLESDASSYRSKQDSSGTEDLKYNHI